MVVEIKECCWICNNLDKPCGETDMNYDCIHKYLLHLENLYHYKCDDFKLNTGFKL